MCGIIGGLFCENKQSLSLESALQSLYHRGPDYQATWHDGHIHLGHTRLSILDLSPAGHQPMSYQQERFWITFNGEIYNYLELRQELLVLGHSFRSQSDTEVLLASYAQWGTACLGKLRGMFAFGIWDRTTHTLFLARDRVGEKPLYYWHNEYCFYFASELKALLQLLPEKPKLDPVAIDLFLHYQYVPEPGTPLQGILKLPAAHFLLIDIKTLQIHPKQYWSLDQIEPIEGDPVPLIRQELERVIELTLRSDVPVSVALSGGIDSGAIATLAARKYKDTLQALSVGYPGYPPYDERKNAHELANQLGLPFYDVELSTAGFVSIFPELVAAIDDPIADIAAYGHYAVMKLAADQGIKVMLTGIGGDELFWGYGWVLEAVKLSQQKQQNLHHPIAPQWTWSALEHLTNHPFYQRLAQSCNVPGPVRLLFQKGFEISKTTSQYPHHAVFYDLIPDFKNALYYIPNLYTKDFAAQLLERSPYRPFELDLINDKDIPIQICRLLFDTWLVSNCLALGDRVSMVSSVEARLPLLDYKFIELVIGLRKTRPDHTFKRKFWLKLAIKEVVPEKVLNRPKRGFQPPIQEWMEAIIQTYKRYLETGYLVQLNIIAPDYLRRIMDKFEQKQKYTFTVILYKLVLLEVWYRQIVLQNFDT